MADDKEHELHEQIDWLIFLLAGVLGLGLCVAYVVRETLKPEGGDVRHALITLFFDVSPDLIAASVLFVAVYICLNKVESMRTSKEYEALAGLLSERLGPALRGGSPQ